MNILFRVMTREDIPAVIDLCNTCFDENTSLEYAYKVYDNTYMDENNIYLVGEVDGAIIAHSKVTIIHTIYEEMNTYAILNHVCVKNEYRRHNIATKMLDEITKICQEKNVKIMELWSKNKRLPAHSCYKKYGFLLEEAGFFSKEI